MVMADEIEYLDSFIAGLSDDEIDEINSGCGGEPDPIPFRAFARYIGIEL